MVKVKTIKRTSKRIPRVVYRDGYATTTDNAVFVNPQDGNIQWDYDSFTGLAGIGNSYPGCTNIDNLPAASQLRRYCHIATSLKDYYQIIYEYYSGHKFTYQEVIQKKVGNCCDIARLVNHIARDSLQCTTICGSPITSTRYVICNIDVGGGIYTHLYNELYVNGEWLIFDGVNYLINGSAKNIFGEIMLIVQRIDGSTDGAPCG